MPNKVIILGKPNVGKSSLFNAILKKNIAIVDNFSGLTRDLRKKEIKLWDKTCEIIDSPGLIWKVGTQEKNTFKSTIKYAQTSNLIILVFDGRDQLTSLDYEVIQNVRKLDKPIIIVINKTEGNFDLTIEETLNSHGFKNPILLSASHNQNIDQLKWKIYESIQSDKDTEEEKQEDKITVAIVGKTNTGKSTIFNLINKSELSSTGPLPNLTRDSVEAEVVYEKLKFKIFDTAGFSKKNSSKIDQLSINQTKKKIRLCKFILLVLDINDYFEKINSKILSSIFLENRCYLILINKIDTLKDFSKVQIVEHLFQLNPQIKGIPIFFVSAKKNIGFKQLEQTIHQQTLAWNKRVRTSELNKWLNKISSENPPPLFRGNTVKLKYISQVNTSPPKFTVFCNHPNSINNQYKRYVSNKLKKKFQLDGLPIKIIFKNSENPYDKN